MIDAEQSNFQHYFAEVPVASLPQELSAHLQETAHLFASLPEEKSGYAYAEGKWTVRQLLGHILISQRIFVTRALCIARGEQKPFPGYEQNEYALDWPPEVVGVGELASAYAAEAHTTRNWFQWMTLEELEREGVASEVRIKPQQLFRALIGHERHHLRVLRDRYGLPFSGNGSLP